MEPFFLFINIISFIVSVVVFNFLYKYYYYSLDRLEKLQSKNPEAYRLTLKKMVDDENHGLRWYASKDISARVKQMYEEVESHDKTNA